MQKALTFGGLLATTSLLFSPVSQAANFNITGASTSAQTLGSGSGQTGAVASGGSLTVSGTPVAVSITGNNATLSNLGTIFQSGTGRAVRDNTGVTGLTVNNGSSNNSTALMKTADADVIQMNKAVASVTLNNYGTMTSLNASAGGSQVVDFAAITTGSNIINNYSTGIMQATEADAVRPGVGGTVNNAGLMKSTTSTGSSSDGVDVQNNSGVQITNDTSGTIEGARHGITGGALDNTVTFTASVTNNAGGIIKGDNGSGINLDGFNANQNVTVVNHGTITGNGVTGDGDGIDVDGLVNITNTGIIRSINAYSSVVGSPAQSEGISVGGGTITNSGTIEGLVAAGNTNAVGRGISLLGNDVTSGPLAGTREAIYGDATVTNQAGGLIRGDSDSGIAVNGPASGHTVTINNNAGATIQGGGTANAAILTGADNDTITNAGIINGSSSGKAIDLGGGTNTLNIQGGAASVQGDMSGGTGTSTLNLNIGTGNSFAYNGALSNFTTVQVNSGTTTLAGASSYSGATTMNGGTLLAANTTGSATGTGAVEVKSGASLGGTGSIAGTVTVDQGGTLATGIGGVGTLHTGNTTLASNSTFALDLDPKNAGGLGFNDMLSVGGAVSLANANLVLTLLSAPTADQTFNILLNDGSDAISGLFSQGHTVAASYGGRSYNFYVSYSSNADSGSLGNDIQLKAIPEPATVVWFGLGGVLLLLQRRFAVKAVV
ncbi:hypothetical protein KFZ76_20120 [Methylovulum psychrotolerans]|uniref:beta strand repeat-containing protein n=1 Tax=Methylovulum psychrotolerans TaxID=1704499 RepID=UPI001BFF4E81|nr:hypothetical protein [Methylovulum psychrotolerans]MBT9100011.1 hypothetical protein [Methylovulum psychrotolerans]